LAANNFLVFKYPAQRAPAREINREYEMNSLKLAFVAALALAGVALTTGGAFAVQAQATTAVNVRSGPGPSYGVVDTLYAGEQVDVTECNPSGSWCYVQHDGPDGWVSASYLQNTSGAPAPSSNNGPSINFGITVPLGHGGSITFGTGNPPPPPAATPRVCFYGLSNYHGNSFCAEAGDHDNHLGSFWNDRISSLRVYNGASVRVCVNNYMGPYCRTYNHSVSTLGTLLNNRISSYRVYP
jgi:uncharacterized protein YraI